MAWICIVSLEYHTLTKRSCTCLDLPLPVPSPPSSSCWWFVFLWSISYIILMHIIILHRVQLSGWFRFSQVLLLILELLCALDFPSFLFRNLSRAPLIATFHKSETWNFVNSRHRKIQLEKHKSGTNMFWFKIIWYQSDHWSLSIIVIVTLNSLKSRMPSLSMSLSSMYFSSSCFYLRFSSGSELGWWWFRC